MLKSFFLLSCLTVAVIALAQKPVLDFEAYKKYPQFGSSTISNDGKYLYFLVEDKSGISLTIRSTENNFHKEIRGLNSRSIIPVFTEDSRYLIFSTARR